MPKNRSVASFRGNFSPVERSKTIFVSRMRHFRGDTGDVLNMRAGGEMLAYSKVNGTITTRAKLGYLLDRLKCGLP